MTGILYGIGVGPGDPELLTLKAVRIIKESDIIAIPSKDRKSCVAYKIVAGVYPEIDQKMELCLDYPMTKNEQVLKENHVRNTELVIKELQKGKKVAFLTLGDPTVYSTFMYLFQKVREQGYISEIVSGVPSFCAMAARLGISLGEKEEEIHLIPASYGRIEQTKLSGTIILMKAGKKLKEIKSMIVKSEENMYVAMIENCGMEREEVVTGVDNLPEEAGYYTTVILRKQKIETLEKAKHNKIER